ncbi:MAG TPA: nitrilase-related carbon-nitrogen hydrolase, partial [Chloroflexota bacterium]|nr:nitrilase-related carbon-nitrogen hydrolase [Chloroflexota bacterium]
MSILRVGLLQLLDKGSDQEANLAIGEAACRHAAELGADIALFPEMWNIGYTP